MWLGEQIDTMLFNGIQVHSLLAKAISRDFYSVKDEKSFDLYYVGIRISGDDHSSGWAGCDESIAFLLELTEKEYIRAANLFGAHRRQDPCKITYFKTEAEINLFLEEFVEPKLMGTKLKYIDKKVINRETYPQWQG